MSTADVAARLVELAAGSPRGVGGSDRRAGADEGERTFAEYLEAVRP